MKYTVNIFRAESDPALAKSLIGQYRSLLAQMGVSHVMSLDIPPDSPNLYFAAARTSDGNHIGAMGAYICSPAGGDLENAFCKMAPGITERFRAQAHEGLANLCLGFVDPRHRNNGLYAHIIRVVVAMLPTMGIRYITAAGATKGIRYYGRFGMLMDESVGDNGKFMYPPGICSNLGWADLLNPPMSTADEQFVIQEMRQTLCARQPDRPRPRRHTSALNRRAQDLSFTARLS